MPALPDGVGRVPASERVAPVTLPDGVSPAFARSARFWARAYPRRWRAARGAELLGLLADLAAPGAQRLDARSALDLIRAGWATRLRQHPPLGPWLQYRLVGTRSLAAYRPWVADDIAGLLFPLRQSLGWVLLLVVLEGGRRLNGQPSLLSMWWIWGMAVAILVNDELVLGGRTRAAARATHLVPRAGERVTPGSWVRVRWPRRRVAATVALPWAAGVATALLATSVVATALAPTTVSFAWLPSDEGFGFSADGGGPVPRVALLALLGVALAVGAGLGALARRRLVRVDTTVVQPERELVRLGARRAAGVLLLTAAVGALPVAEALGEVSLLVSVVVGLAAAVLAPSAVVAWLVVRRRRELQGLAYVDVRRVALRGRAPLVDAPGSCLSPARETEIGEVWPWPWSNEGPTTALG
ncbi:hypothetical protein [Actinotalea fermentans]|uniref:Uncharacterized protein n=1 Tax=Actinotalea fermentans TaxID=43671 RepID=A0A511YYU7_9CELL|nr:hypothetical protein [Actinotalea fermentans]GEN80354.1 hypothetical protein AFE02nite_20880 [Actinotalea fermentans]